jgi:type VI secretion system secreted protein VgrG
MSITTVSVEMSLASAHEHRVVAARVTEGISRLTHLEVEVVAEDGADFSSSLQAETSVRVLLDGVPARTWTGQVGKTRFLGFEDSAARHAIELFPRLWFLRHTKNTRKFRNKTAQEIITAVLSEGNVPHEWRITRTPPRRKYCVQYRESNLDFVLRLLEFEGIYYTFTSDDVLVLGDMSRSAGFVEAATHYELLDAADALTRDALGIHAWKKRAKVASGKATVNDFNWKKPRLNLIESHAAAHDTELETYDYPTGYRNPKDGKYLAQIRLEAQRVPSRTSEGKGNVPQFSPLHKFTFGDAGGPGFAGEYLLTEVVHRVHNVAVTRSLLLPGQDIYENTFTAIPSSVPFRPEWITPRPEIEGTHTAMVRGPEGAEIYTDQYGRFRAQFHWDREAKGTDEDSRWVRPLQEVATSMVLARVGWEMSIAYIDGDPDRPVGVARNINGVMVPAYAQPSNKSVMTIKTPTSPKNGGYNEIRLDDRAGSQSFYIRAERDLVGVVKNDKGEYISNNETHYVAEEFNHNVDNDQTVVIGENSETSCGNDYRLEVKGNRTLEVGGNEDIDVGATASYSVFGDDKETVGSARITEAGLESKGSINRKTEEKLTRQIGGAFIAIAKENIQTVVKKNYTEIVGALKLTQTKNGSIAQVVSGKKELKVGASIMRQSGEDMGAGAEKTEVEVGAIARVNSKERVEYRGKVITLEARSSISFKAPGLEITLTPGQATLKGKSLFKAGEALKTTGGPDNITK